MSYHDMDFEYVCIHGEPADKPCDKSECNPREGRQIFIKEIWEDTYGKLRKRKV